MKRVVISFILISGLIQAATIQSQMAAYFWKIMDNGIVAINPMLVTENREMGEEAFELLNKYRDENGLDELDWNEDAYLSSLDHTYYMIKQGGLSHDNFDDRVTALRANNENVAFFSSHAVKDAESGGQQFITMWKNSLGHDKNMKSTTIGQGAVAVASYNKDGVFLYYSTMLNLRPKE